MATYREMYAKAKKAKETKKVEALRWKGVEPGDNVCGLLMTKRVGKSRRFDSHFNIYTLKTEEGVTDCILGSATDAEVGNAMEVGQIYYIEYTGKEAVAGGLERKNHDVILVPPETIED